RQRVCPPNLLGRMNASVRFIVWGTQPIGALIGGALGTAFGLVPVMWLTVAGTALAAAPVAFSPLMRMRDIPDDPLVASVT
ncbi:MAG: MFS transporter, partial [Actinomycetes bacterium]